MAADLKPSSKNINFIKEYKYNPVNEKLKFTSIIILTYNQLDYTKICIESIRKFTHKEVYEIIIVDNNSTDGTVEWLKKQTDLNVIYNKENKGFPAGCNQGINIAKGDNILLLNNDVIVTPMWLNNLQTALYSKEDIGGVGCITNSCSNFQQIPIEYKNVKEMLEFSNKINISSSSSWDSRCKLIGFCYMIKRSVLDKVGFLDEIFTPGNFEDDDISFRILKEGYKLLLCRDVFIHHYGSASFGQNTDKFTNVLQINSQKFFDKWGFNAYDLISTRFDLIDLIKDDSLSPINVLEVGCGVGSNIISIKNQFRNANIYGIEKSEVFAMMARNNVNITQGNVETIDLPYDENYFDYIVLSDICEHLENPYETLNKLRKYLKQDGFILASFLNIMHISVLKKILNGYFIYENQGILDKKHNTLFSLAEIQKMFNECEFKIENLYANGSELSSDDNSLLSSLCKITNENLRQQYMSYQYIIKAKNNTIPKKEILPQEIIDLKTRLIRLDLQIDINESLEFIFSKYSENDNTFIKNIKEIIDKYILRKDEVYNVIISEAQKRNLQDFYKEFKGI